MKYLKTFESADTEYYKKINADQVNMYYRGNDILKMSEKNINMIKSFSNKIRFSVEYVKSKDRIHTGTDYSYCSLYIRDTTYQPVLYSRWTNIGSISELKDEWFITSFGGFYYLCDQLEGLKKCFNKQLKSFI